MRRLIVIFILISTIGHSQNKQILYGFDEIPQSMLLNPGATVQNHWFVGIPLLSHIHTNVGLSGLTIYDVFADNNVDFNTKLRRAVSNLSANDHFAINQQLELFSGGIAFGKSYEKDKYLSFGLYQETDVFMYFPKDYATLGLEGNQNNINRVFDVSHLNFTGEVISVFHVGYNRKINQKWTAGIRGKIYSSIFNIKSTNNQGSFVTRQGQNNYYNHIFNLDMQVQTSGLASLLDDENSDFSSDIKGIRRRLLFGGNLGLGFDIGFTYTPNDRWVVQASLLDVGFISHKKDVEQYRINGYYEFEGINPIFDESEENQTAEDYWNEISDEFEDLFELDTIRSKYTSWRPFKLNTFASYAFGKKVNKDCNCLEDESGYQNKVGAHLFMINRPKAPQMALTVFYFRRLLDQLLAKVTYTVDSYSFNNLGLGLSTNLKGLNFYIMADNLLEYQNLAKSKSVSLQLGFNYIFK